MVTKPTLIDSTAFFSEAVKYVAPGNFRYWESNPPSFVQTNGGQRPAGSYNCAMLVSTAWSGGAIGGITPTGNVYLLFNYADDKHRTGPPHFNKDVHFFFCNERGVGLVLTLNKDVDGHYIDAAARGTALPYLRQAYNLPDKPNGTLQDLTELGTSLLPYPGSGPQQSV